MTIIHGDNIVGSREKLHQIVAEAKTKKKEVTYLEGKKISLADIEVALQSNSLFGSDKSIVIEQLFSRPHSKKRTELMEYLSKNRDTEVILWDKKVLTAAQKKKLAPDQEFQFKTSKKLFAWIDSISPQTSIQKRLHLYQETLSQEDAYLCFYMLTQRMRQLLIISEGGNPGGAPFMISKMKSQARQFTQQQLESIHTSLYKIDRETKTEGPKQLTLEQKLRQLQLEF